MSKSKIEWTNQTWNPIIGCSKISDGCANCYAEKQAFRVMCMLQKQADDYTFVLDNNGKADPEQFRYIPKWNGQTHFVKSAIEKPLHWRKPRMIFVCSMGDLFHENVPFEWIDKVMEVIKHCPQHTFQILTKRHERMHEYFHFKDVYAGLPNVWLGVTAENQEQANKRIPILSRIPAVIRFISIEPMLSHINLTESLIGCSIGFDRVKNGTPDWVIVGGESGPNARPMHPDWVRSIRNQCQESNVPFFFKQWGGWQEGSHVIKGSYTGFHALVFNDGTYKEDFSNELQEKLDNTSPDEWNSLKPNMMARVGKKQAGRLLDGKEYNEFPKA